MLRIMISILVFLVWYHKSGSGSDKVGSASLVELILNVLINSIIISSVIGLLLISLA